MGMLSIFFWAGYKGHAGDKATYSRKGSIIRFDIPFDQSASSLASSVSPGALL